jgi:hypothetical protein
VNSSTDRSTTAPDAEGDGGDQDVTAQGVAQDGQQDGAPPPGEGAADDEQHARAGHHDQQQGGRREGE